MGDTITELVTSSEIRFQQIQIMGQVQAQACMLGIQELATKLQMG